METVAGKGSPRDMNKWREVLLDPNVQFPGESGEYRRARNQLLEAEDAAPGTVFDHAFIREHTHGFGDFIADLPVNAFIHPAGRPIDTPRSVEVLRRPVESAHVAYVRVMTGNVPPPGAEPGRFTQRAR